jgi:hypothetical protein
MPQKPSTSSSTQAEITLTEDQEDMEALFTVLEQIFPATGAFNRIPLDESPLPEPQQIAQVARLADKYDVIEAVRMVFCASIMFCYDAEWACFLFGIATNDPALCKASMENFHDTDRAWVSVWDRESAELLGYEMYWALREASEKVEGKMDWDKVSNKMDWAKALGL